MNKVFVSLQVVATLALAAAVEQFAVKGYWVALAATVVGVACYVVYEVLPPKN